MEDVKTRLMFSPLFKGISPDDIGSLISQVDYQKRTYPKGVLIAQRGDEYNTLLIILSGLINAEMIDRMGKVVQIEALNSGMALATAVIFSNNPKLPVNITTITDTEILYLPKKSLVALIQKSAVLNLNLLQMISNRATFLTERIWFLSFKTIREKLCHYILENINEDTWRCKMKLTQQQMADYFGVTRPALARSLAQLETEKIIKVEAKEIIVMDVKKLKMTNED